MSFEVLQGTVGAFAMFLPSAISVRHKDPRDGRQIEDMRLGFLLAGVWSFVIAAHYASKENSSQPYLFWVIGAAGMVTLYELALRDTRDVDLRDNG